MLRKIFVACLMISVVTLQVPVSAKKDPAIAGFLSAVLPGGGQFYNGEPGKAVIPIGGAIAFLSLYHLAYEDGGSFSLYGGFDDDIDNDDYLAVIGTVIILATQTYGVLDAISSANKINRRGRQFGHTIEFDGDRTTLGVDPIASRNRLGTMVSLRF